MDTGTVGVKWQRNGKTYDFWSATVIKSLLFFLGYVQIEFAYV
jgi:hypothetical protein